MYTLHNSAFLSIKFLHSGMSVAPYSSDLIRKYYLFLLICGENVLFLLALHWLLHSRTKFQYWTTPSKTFEVPPTPLPYMGMMVKTLGSCLNLSVDGPSLPCHFYHCLSFWSDLSICWCSKVPISSGWLMYSGWRMMSSGMVTSWSLVKLDLSRLAQSMGLF